MKPPAQCAAGQVKHDLADHGSFLPITNWPAPPTAIGIKRAARGLAFSTAPNTNLHHLDCPGDRLL